MERYYGFDVLGVEEEQNVDGGIAFGTACLIIGGSVLLISAGVSAFNGLILSISLFFQVVSYCGIFIYILTKGMKIKWINGTKHT